MGSNLLYAAKLTLCAFMCVFVLCICVFACVMYCIAGYFQEKIF